MFISIACCSGIYWHAATRSNLLSIMLICLTKVSDTCFQLLTLTLASCCAHKLLKHAQLSRKKTKISFIFLVVHIIHMWHGLFSAKTRRLLKITYAVTLKSERSHVWKKKKKPICVMCKNETMIDHFKTVSTYLNVTSSIIQLKKKQEDHWEKNNYKKLQQPACKMSSVIVLLCWNSLILAKPFPNVNIPLMKSFFCMFGRIIHC